MRVSQSGNNPVQGSDETSVSKRAERASQSKNAKAIEKAKGLPEAEASQDVAASISSKGKEFARVKALASQAPDVREEKIAELKRRIAAGKYHMDVDAVADKMVEEHLKTPRIG